MDSTVTICLQSIPYRVSTAGILTLIMVSGTLSPPRTPLVQTRTTQVASPKRPKFVTRKSPLKHRVHLRSNGPNDVEVNASF